MTKNEDLKVLFVHANESGVVQKFTEDELKATLANLSIDALMCCYPAQVAAHGYRTLGNWNTRSILRPTGDQYSRWAWEPVSQ